MSLWSSKVSITQYNVQGKINHHNRIYYQWIG